MITIDQLMNKFAQQQNGTFIVKLGNDEYECHKLPFKQILGLDDEYDVETQAGAYERNLEAIYLSCDIFRKLLDKIDVEGDPHNVICEVLTPIEVLTFYTQILNQYVGQLKEDVETIKK
jgi:hypothetical protein